MTVEDIIEDLIMVILTQEKQINEMKRKIDRINQYIEFYEKEIK